MYGRLIREAGFELVWTEDATANEVMVSKRWRDAQKRCAPELIQLEGEERFATLQGFLDTVNRLIADQRLSRFAYQARPIIANSKT